MKKMSVMLFMLLFTTSLVASTQGFATQIQENTEGFMVLIWWMLKLAGFAIIIWGIADLMSEEQGQGNGGGKYIKAGIKIIVGGAFIGAKTLYDQVK